MNYLAELDKCNRSVITQWANNHTKLEKCPWLCYISVTNICNSRCTVCAHGKAMRRDKGALTFSILKRIIGELPNDVRKIYLMKQGEPFLSRNLERFVSYIRKQKPHVHIALHTNGILAKKERVEKILPEINSMGISISAISTETYKKVHGVNKFELVKRNLKDISEILLRMESKKKPHVFIDYVSQKNNAHEEKRDIVNFFESQFPGLSSVDLHWVYNFQGEIEEGNMEVYHKVPYDKFPCCVFPWSSITFLHDGKVSYCFVEPRENRFLGDITIQTFEEIWNGNEYRMFRKRMAKGRFGEMADDGIYCHRCSWLWSMQSQSPRNLNYGYSGDLRSSFQYPSFGELLDLPIEQIFEIGIELYLKGEIHRAMGYFGLVLSSGCDEGLFNASKEMNQKCKNVLRKYRYLALWREMMEEEGFDSHKKSCKYYSLGEN
ncbi:MAG: radical SAM protein [Desulfobacterales bacterium]|nr:radical SAM protein [Desulfobacterales bacterium]